MRDYNSTFNAMLKDSDRALINKHQDMVEKMRTTSIEQHYVLKRIHYVAISYSGAHTIMHGGKFKKVFKETINRLCRKFDIPISFPEIEDG